jgi:choice-of-anchor B domain-containing protein
LAVPLFFYITILGGIEVRLPKSIMSIVLPIAVLSFLHESANAQSSGGVTLVDTLNRAHGLSGQNTKFSSCWGWVSSDGREYALVGCYFGTSIVDLNVSPIREIAFVSGNTASYAYREFKTYKNYAYIVSEGGRGVQILDMSRLPDTSGLLVREFNFTNGSNNIVRSHTVTLADGYLYLNGSSGWGVGGMVIFSLKNDPTNPQYVGEYQPMYIHDSYVRNDTLYGAAIYGGGGLYVTDIRNKTNPLLIRKISYNGSGTHHAWASIDGRYALTTDEIGTVNNLKIWDMANLGSGPPYTPVAQYATSPADIIHNVHGRGNYAYVSHYTGGMRVVDVHNPATPVEAGGYDTYPGPSGGYAGCWGVYPYFPSGRWIGTDMQTGLYVCRFTGLASRQRSHLLAPANLDTLFQGGSKSFRWQSAARQSEDPHYYEVHIWGPGLDTLMRTRDTSLSVSSFTGIQSGKLYRWHVWIKDEYTQVSSRDTFLIVLKNSSSTSVGDAITPSQFSLAQNYPNPFNPSTTIAYRLPSATHVTLKAFNTLGEQVAVLVDEFQVAGFKSVRLDASKLPSGVYFYTLNAAGLSQTKKMILVR